MTKATVEQKLAAFRVQHARALADVNALGGAIQCCEQLLAEWDRPEAIPMDILVAGAPGAQES